MPAHTHKTDNKTSPFRAERFKSRDHTRLPETYALPTAEVKRDNMQQDASDTSIRMTLAQFQRDVIPVSPNFDVVCTDAHITNIWWLFNSEVGGTRTLKGKYKPRQGVIERDYSKAWAKVDGEYGLCPDHLFHISESKSEDTDTNGYKVDGSFIHKADSHLIVPEVPNWALQRLAVEFKRDGYDSDAFDDRVGFSVEPDAVKRKKVRAQLMSYAETIFHYQHRVALFMFFVHGSEFRAMRWDRSGVIVTEAINYVATKDGTKALLQLLYGFSALSSVEQGFDPTAVRLSEGSCEWERMDLLSNPCKGDISSDERWIDDPTTIHSVFLKPYASNVTPVLPSCSHQESGSEDSSKSAVLPVMDYVRALFRESLVKGWPRYKITVCGFYFLVAKPNVKGFGMLGRGTRGYVALRWETQEFVFLKDTWPTYCEGILEEGVVLRMLNDAAVPNVPTIVCHEKVDGEQETETSNYSPATGRRRVENLPRFQPTNAVPPGGRAIATIPKKRKTEPKLPLTSASPVVSAKTSYSADLTPHSLPALAPIASNDQSPSTSESCPRGGVKRTADDVISEDKYIQGTGLRHRVHYRIIVKEVCLPITKFKNSRQLVELVADCIKAHGYAYKNCSIFHRDVSAGNLLIYPEVVRMEDGKFAVCWKGLLTDWELAKDVNSNKACQPERTGTWHFLSVYVIDHPNEPLQVADELESFVHVIIYCAMRLVRHNLEEVPAFMHSYFDGYAVNMINGHIICPTSKRLSVVTHGTLTDGVNRMRFLLDDGTANHPLNILLDILLKRFQARYIIDEWKKRHEPQTPGRNKQSKDASRGYRKADSDDELEGPPVIYREDEMTQIPTTTQPLHAAPSVETEEDARTIHHHATVRKILKDCLKLERWPEEDSVPDRLRCYVPPPRVDEGAVPSRVTKKTRKDEAEMGTGAAEADAEPEAGGSNAGRA